MKIYDIENGHTHHEYRQFSSLKEAYEVYPETLELVEAPDWVLPGYGYDPTAEGDARFIRPELSEGWEYDSNGYPWNPTAQREAERKRLHEATTNDTLEALRKIRAGDTTIDWQSWLDALDEYNRAITATQDQDGYPSDVTYPDYPVKPTGINAR